MAESLTVANLANADFRRLVAGLGDDLAVSSPRTIEFVFDDDLPVRVVLHSDEQCVVTEVFLYDAAMLTGALRNSMVKTCLLLNHAALCGELFHVGLDSRNFLMLFGTQRLTALTAESCLKSIDYLVLQARRLRRLVRTIAFQDANLSYSLGPGQSMKSGAQT